MLKLDESLELLNTPQVQRRCYAHSSFLPNARSFSIALGFLFDLTDLPAPAQDVVRTQQGPQPKNCSMGPVPMSSSIRSSALFHRFIHAKCKLAIPRLAAASSPPIARPIQPNDKVRTTSRPACATDSNDRITYS